MDDKREPELVTLLSAVADLKAATERRHLLRRSDPEYALALSEEVKLSEVVFQLAHEIRVKGQAPN